MVITQSRATLRKDANQPVYLHYAVQNEEGLVIGKDPLLITKRTVLCQDAKDPRATEPKNLIPITKEGD